MQAHAGFLVKNSDLPSHTSAGGIVGERDIRAAGDCAAGVGYRQAVVLHTQRHVCDGQGGDIHHYLSEKMYSYTLTEKSLPFGR